MRIFSRPVVTQSVRAAIAAMVVVATGVFALAAEPVFRSPEDALKQGLGAYRGGYYEIAIPALQYAADEDSLLAKYYLAQIYSDNLGSRTDHARAFDIYQSIVDDYADIDPDLDPRAPVVGQSMTAYARYVREGVPDSNVKANPSRAQAYFNNASMTFNNEDAQFELAKMYLSGDGVRRDHRLARHWLSTLTRKGHPGAQAFLADLLWRGKHVDSDPVRALALIAVAVENAPPQERLWIEDIYQTIYCGAASGVRKQANGIVANWGKRYNRKPYRPRIHRKMPAETNPIRTCKNGEYVGHSLGRRDPRVTVQLPEPSGALNVSGKEGFALGSTAAPPSRAPALGLRGVSTPGPRR